MFWLVYLILSKMLEDFILACHDLYESYNMIFSCVMNIAGCVWYTAYDLKTMCMWRSRLKFLSDVSQNKAYMNNIYDILIFV